MAHDYPVKEIALQAGLSLATVDRVLHQRAGVSEGTQRRVWQAWDELARQRQQLGLKGQRLFVDVVLDTPGRFARLIRDALAGLSQSTGQAVFRWRFHHVDPGSESQTLDALDQVARRGSQGILLKSVATPAVADAVLGLVQSGMPVITLVTDLPAEVRTAYVGPDNAAAGETAAYLMTPWLDGRGQILVSASSTRFHGESQRLRGFERVLAQHGPAWSVVVSTEGQGLLEPTRAAVETCLRDHPGIRAVYSVGGANRAIWDALETRSQACEVFIGHDLDEDNRLLLQSGRLHFELHQRHTEDLSRACDTFLAAHGFRPADVSGRASAVEVITPYNVPALPA